MEGGTRGEGGAVCAAVGGSGGNGRVLRPGPERASDGAWEGGVRARAGGLQAPWEGGAPSGDAGRGWRALPGGVWGHRWMRALKGKGPGARQGEAGAARPAPGGEPQGRSRTRGAEGLRPLRGRLVEGTQGGGAGPPGRPRGGSGGSRESLGGEGVRATVRGCPQGQLTRRTGRRPRCPRAPPRPRAAWLPSSRALGPRRGGSAISERTLPAAGLNHRSPGGGGAPRRWGPLGPRRLRAWQQRG